MKKPNSILSSLGVVVLFLIPVLLASSQARGEITDEDLKKEMAKRQSLEHQVKMMRQGTTLEIVTKKREDKDHHHATTKSPTLLRRMDSYIPSRSRPNSQ